MVDFNDLPKTELKKFIVVENNDSFGNRLFIIKKIIPFNQRTSYNKKYSTKDIPHKYQQNNTLEEASNSIRKFLIEEEGITPSKKYHHRPSKRMVYLKLFLRFFGVRL